MSNDHQNKRVKIDYEEVLRIQREAQGIPEPQIDYTETDEGFNQRCERIYSDATNMLRYLEKGNNDNENDKSFNNMQKRYSWLATNYPQVFTMVFRENKNFDLNRLKFMLQQLKKVRYNESSKYQADSNVGEELAHQFLYPAVGGKPNIDHI